MPMGSRLSVHLLVASGVLVAVDEFEFLLSGILVYSNLSVYCMALEFVRIASCLCCVACCPPSISITIFRPWLAKSTI